MIAAAAILLWVAAFLLQFATFSITNDHFDRISRARQIARYGDLPFRDFFDPGYFMSVLSSAGLQRLIGDSLLADMLLDASFIATGTVIVLLLARRISGSLLVAVAASLLALLTFPRLYDFDKFLFYPLGVLLCWRYIEHRTATNLTLLGAGLVAGTLFRYDTAVYIGSAAVVTIVVVHWRDWKIVAQRLALLAAAVAGIALPFLLFVQVNGGIVNAADQIVTYARRERARTQISSLPRFSFVELVTVVPPPPVDLRPVDTTGVAQALPPPPIWTRVQRALPIVRVRILPGSWHYANGVAFLYCLLFALPVLGAAGLLAHAGAETRQHCARVLSLAAMSLALDLLILRDPIAARVGGMAGPPVLLGVWIATSAWRARSIVMKAVVLALVALTMWAVSVAADWQTHLRSDRASLRRLRDNFRAAATRAGDTMPYGPLLGLVTYIRECTSPRDRVYASWFVPELYFYAERGFAARMLVTFGGHWSEPRFQQRMVNTFAVQSVPVVIIDTHSYDNVQEFYPAFDRYLQTHYRVGGETDFDNPDVGPRGYRVLVRNDRVPAGRHPASSMPCFR